MYANEISVVWYFLIKSTRKRFHYIWFDNFVALGLCAHLWKFSPTASHVWFVNFILDYSCESPLTRCAACQSYLGRKSYGTTFLCTLTVCICSDNRAFLTHNVIRVHKACVNVSEFQRFVTSPFILIARLARTVSFMNTKFKWNFLRSHYVISTRSLYMNYSVLSDLMDALTSSK